MPKHKGTESDRRLRVALEETRKELKGLKYGSLLVVVQDGVAVQIDKTIKNRIDYSSLDKVVDGEGI